MEAIPAKPELDKALKEYKSRVSSAILRPNGPHAPHLNQMLALGANLRNESIWQYPILPGALQVFQQLASSREWTVSGTPQAVPRVVEWLHNTQTMDIQTGYVYYGFETFLQRRSMDYNIVGMTAMTCEKNRSEKPAILEYTDPTLLRFSRPRHRLRIGGEVRPVKPNERVWWYANSRRLRARDVAVHHPFPIGSQRFISPIVYLLPTAMLAWLVRESDLAAVDGRKMRDILLVANPQLESAIEEAITTQAALWSGANPEKVGIPIIPMNYSGSTPVRDLFARLGLSDIPESFNREEFIFYYVNEIASALGLALRHFWNNEKTTNRALEVVQEQRQQQKGPSSFIRSEQRLINNSGFLDQFTEGDKIVRFAFIEETDASSMKNRAEVMKLFAEALEKVASVFGGSVDLESYVAWMQSEGVLPNELSLIGINPELVRENEDNITNKPGEATVVSDEQTTTLPGSHDTDSTEKVLDYDEIRMDSEGKIIDRRKRIFSINKVVRETVRNDMQRNWLEKEDIPDERTDIDVLIEEAIYESEVKAIHLVRDLPAAYTRQWVLRQAYFPQRSLASAAIAKCVESVPLSDKEQEVIDMLALDFQEEYDG